VRTRRGYDFLFSSRPQPYANPYVAGVALGLVLLAAFVFAGRGLGASGAFARSASGLVATVSPSAAADNPYFSRYLADDAPVWRDWLVLELCGVAIGAWMSARIAGRVKLAIDRGPHIASASRLTLAAIGGGAMGAGAVFARGCTSGQALSGGAMLSVGSWLFTIGAFASAYLLAPLLRRAWR
jgi:uncharacterized protein